MKHILFRIMVCATLSLLFPIMSHAQIGYQLSLLNTATGEPRAGVTVNATVTITDSADKVIYTGTQQATSNDFGVLSLTVGNADTFSKADFGKLPFFISVSVDGTLIGKSQILSVPVAEYAKKTGELTAEKLVGTWRNVDEESSFTFTFFADGTFKLIGYSNGSGTVDGTYFIDGNILRWEYTTYDSYYGEYYTNCGLLFYFPTRNILVDDGGLAYTKQ